MRERFLDPHEDPDALSTALTAAAGGPEGGTIVVTDFPAPFELRKLQWRFSRAPSGGTVEDVAVNTFHFIKATGGVPGTYADTTDLAAVETAATTYWAAIKASRPTYTHSDQYRWYKDGPAFYHAPDAGQPYFLPNGENPAIRITEVDVAGGSAATPLPPQMSLTVTEKTSARKHWGRYYLEPPNTTSLSGDGRLSSGVVTTELAAAVAFYNSCRSASMIPVVFAIEKPSRPKRPSGTLAAAPAVAYEVTALQIDNLLDVMRSRRWSSATSKLVTTLT